VHDARRVSRHSAGTAIETDLVPVGQSVSETKRNRVMVTIQRELESAVSDSKSAIRLV